MRLTFTARLALTVILASAASTARAQSAAAPAAYPAPEVGTLAPDFTLPGATRYGTLKEPVRLSDFRGKTVVLAFFYRARTKG
ncbi:MAG: redoxin domain-containing protein [Gemmatimonadaceae bacterium]